MIIKGIILDDNQKSLVENKKYAPDSYFYPFKDKNNNWIISYEEQKNCINPTFWWIKDLDVVDVEILITIQ